jgi:hypothetical protein
MDEYKNILNIQDEGGRPLGDGLLQIYSFTADFADTNGMNIIGDTPRGKFLSR